MKPSYEAVANFEFRLRFSAHGLQTADATLPNYINVNLGGEAQEEADPIYRIARSADSGALMVPYFAI